MAMKILKASAGSGKTYNLAKEYIKILLQSENRDAYRHVLAVTFTNKATDEMKRRILRELHTLAKNPEKSPYFKDLVPSVIANKTDLQNKAEAMLTGILHDYSTFAVSTIDKFFQQTLRAFSREIGQFASYQVELEKDALVDDAVERVMENLSQANRPLLYWVINGVKYDLSTTGRFTLDKRLKEMALNIVSEKPGDTDYSRENLASIKGVCGGVIERFCEKVTNAARAVVDAIAASGINAEDTNRGFMKAVYAYTDITPREPVVSPTASFLDKAGNPEKWFAKTKMHLLEVATDYIYGPMQEFVALFEAPFKEYSTAVTINSQIYGLGLAQELRKAFVEVQKERGVISIEDTNTILHDIIDGTETPFLYEKLGVRFENFLLDEFQDTSGIQWDNFLPLLQNSDSEGKENLVVGDVKQSIYRWRGSQWDLLDSRLQQQFRVPTRDITVLDGNYRTCKSVVEFNNAFFPYAAAQVDRLVGNNPTEPGSLQSIYGDVIQEVRTKDASRGSVEISFVESVDDELKKVVENIRNATTRGARYSDIAILVRGNADGALVASRLVDEGIPVMSDDSLFVKSSVTVRRLVSQLALVDNPTRAEGGNVAGFLANELRLTLPEQYHSLTDLTEEVLSDLRNASPELFDNETPFIQAFVDWVQEWTRKNGNNLGAMLRDWTEAEPKIASPENMNAVRVMTVHKSKGLEFPYVIFPFAEKVTLYKPTSYWCRPDVQGTELERVAGKRFRANLSDNSMSTLFREDYIRERSQQAVDNMNVLYVALTRAKCELSIISVKPPKSVLDTIGDDKMVQAKNLSHLIYAYIQADSYQTGEPYDYTALDRTVSGPSPIELKYVCSGVNSHKRLCFRTAKTDEPDMPDSNTQEMVSEQAENEMEPTLF